jgi:hypothetical protein
MPKAPPSSVQVSRIPDAAPERSAGTDATVISVASTYTGASPMEKTIAPVTSTGRPDCASSCVSSPKPAAVTARLRLSIHTGRRRLAPTGASAEPRR